MNNMVVTVYNKKDGITGKRSVCDKLAVYVDYIELSTKDPQADDADKESIELIPFTDMINIIEIDDRSENFDEKWCECPQATVSVIRGGREVANTYECAVRLICTSTYVAIFYLKVDKFDDNKREERYTGIMIYPRSDIERIICSDSHIIDTVSQYNF